MNALTGIDMTEVTRLTRSGHLREATALLQRGLVGHSAPSPTTASATFDMLAPSKPDGVWRAAEATAPGPPPQPRPQLFESLGAFRTRPVQDDVRRSSLPPGARFETCSLANPAGRRGYKLYVPSCAQNQPLPLVVMLHGCTQSADDFAAGTRMNELAEELRLLVAYPEQTQAANSSKCWNWFKPSDQARDRGEPSLIADITRQIIRDHAVDPKRVFVAGLSAGGAAAAIMGQTYPDLYAGVCVHSGLACGAAKDVPSAFAAMRSGSTAGGRGGSGVRTIIFHGTADTTVSPTNARALARQFEPVGATTRTIEQGQSEGGMAFTRTVDVDVSGIARLEQWALEGAGHGWSGGSPAGSYTERRGPDASREMMRFFLQTER